MPINVKKALLKAGSLVKRGDAQAAEQIYREILAQFPQNPQAIKALAALSKGSGTLRTRAPAPSREQMSQLVALYRTGRLDEALPAARNLAANYQQDPVIFNFIGVVLAASNEHEQALGAYARALELLPNYAEALCNQGLSFQARAKHREALAAFKQAVKLEPENANALQLRASARRDCGEMEGAVADYQQCLQLQPNNVVALNNLGNLWQYLGNHGAAVANYSQAVELDPSNAEAWYNLAHTEFQARNFDRASETYRRALELQPDLNDARAKVLYIARQLCNWDHPETAADRGLGLEGERVDPHCMLALDPDPDQQLARAAHYFRERCGHITPVTLEPPTSERPRKLRLGYFSANFHDHAVMFLTAGMFEKHDRARFEIHAFAFGPTPRDGMNQRLREAVDKYHDVHHMTEQSIAEMARAEEIDIAIDLMGYTQHCRPGIFAWRAAPVQINYLGYAGTTGMPTMDYIVGDPALTPAGSEAYYSEQLIRMPHSYLVNDDRREIANRQPTRAEQGLPEDAFVFCSFNNTYKISAEEFDIWMRLLQRVEKSVLWLSGSSEVAMANLRAQAEKRGVEPARLIFATKVPLLSDHLERQRLADLFLDTFNYNAHTTASDALWVGLPMVTRPGKTFASRVGASLLRAAGLEELITGDSEAYEKLALELAQDREKLSGIRDRLEKNLEKAPLFDTARFTRNIEAAFDATYSRYLSGATPAAIVIED